MATSEATGGALQCAKAQAVAEFLLVDRFRAAVSFAARSTPRINVVGIGIGPKVTNGKVTGKQCVRFYVGQRHPDDRIPKANRLPAATACPLM